MLESLQVRQWLIHVASCVHNLYSITCFYSGAGSAVIGGDTVGQWGLVHGMIGAQ